MAASATKCRKVALALCNAERQRNMLSDITRWNDLTDAAKAHYLMLAMAAIDALTPKRDQ